MMFIVYLFFYMDFSVSGVDIVTVSLLNILRPAANSVLFSTLFKGSIVIFSSVGNIDVPMYLLNISFFIYNNQFIILFYFVLVALISLLRSPARVRW